MVAAAAATGWCDVKGGKARELCGEAEEKPTGGSLLLIKKRRGIYVGGVH